MGVKGMKHQRLCASFWVVPNQTLRSLMFDSYVRFDSATIFHQRVNITSPENLGWNCILKLLKREYQQITNIIIWNHVLSSIVLFIGSSIMYSPIITFYIHFTSLLVRCFVPGNPELASDTSVSIVHSLEVKQVRCVLVSAKQRNQSL